MINEIKPETLKLSYDYAEMIRKYDQCDKLFPGNQKFKNTLNTLLKMKKNQILYIAAHKGSKIEEFLPKFLQDQDEITYDFMYVYNFEDSYRPILLKLKRGSGNSFKEKIEGGVEKTLSECKSSFMSKEMKEIVNALKEEALHNSEIEIENLKKEARDREFSTHISEKGVFFIPIINGKKISENEYDNLTADDQEKILKGINELEKKSENVMRKVKKERRESKNKIKEFKGKLLAEIVDKNFEEIASDYSEDDKVKAYIGALKADLELQLRKVFLEMDRDELKQYKEAICLEKIEKENQFKYKVRILRGEEEGKVPVCYEKKTSYYDLFGKLQYVNDGGVFVTDFTLIQEGLVHRANGGYLIVDMSDLIGSRLSWDKIKKIIMEKEIGFDPIREQLGALPIKTIDPEKIPLNIDILMMGDEETYQFICEIDPEFKEICSNYLVLPEYVEANEQNMTEYLAYFHKKELTQAALQGVLEYAIQLSGHKKRLTTKLSALDELICRSIFIAKESGEQNVLEEHVEKAKEDLKKETAQYRELLDEWIKTEQIIIQVKDRLIGQINGLSVSRFLDSFFAYPIRITAASYIGDEGIISIEKENKLCGKIFGKSLEIIKSYLLSNFFKSKPMGMNCAVSFEQVYTEIEGDSASLAQVIAILSSLSGISIEQGIAITGSIDQMGNVQPIGCVKQKIEGFYKICKMKGITGKQGVIIPVANIGEIILNDEVMEAMGKKEFHLYSVSHVEEALPIVMGKKINEVKRAIYRKSK